MSKANPALANLPVLHKAAEGDNAGIITLLAHGADVNARNNEGETPLALALNFSHAETDRDAVSMLLRRHGAKE